MTDEELVLFLSGTSLFRDIDREKIEDYLPVLHGKVTRLDAKSVFIHSGEHVDRIAIILSGSLSVCKIRETGEENLIAKLRPGYMVGVDIASTESRINPYDVYASDETEVFEFSADRILVAGTLPEEIRDIFLHNIMVFLANENIRHQYHTDVLSHHTIREKIMTYLEIRAEKTGKKEFMIPFSREEMANYLCVNRSALSHELAAMKKEGLIEFKKNRFALIYKM